MTKCALLLVLGLLVCSCSRLTDFDRFQFGPELGSDASATDNDKEPCSVSIAGRCVSTPAEAGSSTDDAGELLEGDAGPELEHDAGTPPPPPPPPASLVGTWTVTRATTGKTAGCGYVPDRASTWIITLEGGEVVVNDDGLPRGMLGTVHGSAFELSGDLSEYSGSFSAKTLTANEESDEGTNCVVTRKATGVRQ